MGRNTERRKRRGDGVEDEARSAVAEIGMELI
jgi:hypothetical protein